MKPIETIHLNQRDKQENWIRPKTTQKLLGANLKIYPSWGEHLLYKEKTVLTSIKKKIGAL